MDYSTENYQFWEDRKIYMQLMENFVSEKIDGNQFQRKFYRMWNANLRKDYDQKKVLNQIKDEELKSTELDYFADLISNLFVECDCFEPDPRIRDEFEISEEQLRDFAKKTLLEMKDRYF